jgi:non-heme chloroperoxidase
MASIKVGTENKTDVVLHYEDYGKGKPVVLIHGWPLSGRSWERQISAVVEAGHRVVTYDRRGFGLSSQPWNGYEYDTFAADLNVLLEHLDLEEATLVGFSMGGGEVIRYIAKYGTSRIAKAVLAAAITPYLYKSSDNAEGALDDAAIASFEAGIKKDRVSFLDAFLKNFFAAGKSTDLVTQAQHDYHLNMAAMASPKGTLDCVGAFGRTDFRADMKKVSVPTLIIHGDSDAIVPFEASGKRSHEAIAGSTLALIAGAPHGLNVTHSDLFNRALLEFLAKA